MGNRFHVLDLFRHPSRPSHLPPSLPPYSPSPPASLSHPPNGSCSHPQQHRESHCHHRLCCLPLGAPHVASTGKAHLHPDPIPRNSVSPRTSLRVQETQPRGVLMPDKTDFDQGSQGTGGWHMAYPPSPPPPLPPAGVPRCRAMSSTRALSRKPWPILQSATGYLLALLPLTYLFLLGISPLPTELLHNLQKQKIVDNRVFGTQTRPREVGIAHNKPHHSTPLIKNT